MAQDGDIAEVVNAVQPYSSTGSNLKTRTQNLGKVVTSLSDGNSSILTKLADIASAITASIIGGSTGTTDNRLLRSKGTTGRALDASPVTCDDSGNISTFATLTPNTGGAFRTATANGNTALFQAYDVDGAAYVDVATATAGNTPTFNLLSTTTKGGAGIAVVTQTIGASFTFKAPENETVALILNAQFAWTITQTDTITEVGTSTVTVKIGTTALGGSSNSASTSLNTQAHSSSNSVASTNQINATFASTSSDCENLCLSIWGTRTLAS